MTYSEHKQRVADIVDAAYAAVLEDMRARRSGTQPAIPCRSAGGIGGATGDYEPSGGLELPLKDGADLGELSQRVRRYWESEGFEITSVRPDLTVLARDGEYEMSFAVYPKSGVAVLGASGPCATPDSDAERDTPPELRALRD